MLVHRRIRENWERKNQTHTSILGRRISLAIMGQEKSVPIRCHNCHSYSSSIKTSKSLSASTSQLPSWSSQHKIAPAPVRSQSRSTTKSTKSSQSSKSAHTTHARISSRHSSGSTSSNTSSSYKSIDNQSKYIKSHLFCGDVLRCIIYLNIL